MGILLANPLIIVGSVLTLVFGCSVIDVVKYFYTGHYEFSCFSVITAIPEFLKGFVGGFADFFFKRQSPKKPFVLTQAMIEAVKQKSSEDWVTLLCVKSVDYQLNNWERTLGGLSKHYLSLSKNLSPLEKAASYEEATRYYDLVSDPHKEKRLRVLANLYTPLEYGGVFSTGIFNQSVGDFQLVLEVFTRRLNAYAFYNKKYINGLVFGRSAIPFSFLYGKIVNREYILLTLVDEIKSLESFVLSHKKLFAEITPLGIHTQQPNVLFFDARLVKFELLAKLASQKLTFLKSIEDLDSRIQALVYYEQDRPFWEDMRRLLYELNLLSYQSKVFQVLIEPEVKIQSVLSRESYDALVDTSKVISLIPQIEK